MKTTNSLLLFAAAAVALSACLSTATTFSQSANDGFDPNVSGPVRAIAIQADGRILIGGSFINVGGITRSNIARLNLDGSVDISFNPGANNSNCPACSRLPA